MACVTFLMTSTSNAAIEKPLWMTTTNILKHYQLILNNQTLVPIQGARPSHYQLIKTDKNDENNTHIRYQITFDNIPVWNRQIIIHQINNKSSLTGTLITGIKNDLPDSGTLLSESEAIAPILAQTTNPIKAKEVEHVIYIDNSHKAHHAYFLRFFSTNDDHIPQYPHYMIDALTGHVLEKWDEIKTGLDEGQGPGGNNITLPYRGGAFQYGKSLANLPSLGSFPIDRWVFWCYLQTPEIALLDMSKFYIPYYDRANMFPISTEEEKMNKLSPSYSTCMPWSNYYNQNDDGHAPTNGAASPNNDVMYFVHETLNLYEKHGISQPLGTDLPINAFTHIGDYENAFYIPTIYKKNSHEVYSHQQIVIGDGGIHFSAMTQSVIAHEISHGFTENHSKLAYKDQSGAIDEAFSDMAAIALKDAIQTQYPFYWDREDWTIGSEISKDHTPIRYVDFPTKDLHSIAHIKDYKPGMNVHYASGIFNRAFYLLATQPGWTIQQAFDVMIKANKNYWDSNATFNTAACGVIQAAKDQQLDEDAVKYAFNEVGIVCESIQEPSK